MSVLTALIGTGCQLGTNNENEAHGAPKLPSENSMTLPAFELGNSSTLAKTTVNRSHVGFAYLGVTYWTGATKLALASPVYLFHLAHSASPEALEDGSGFKWVLKNGVNEAVLTGQPSAGSSKWTMTVSNEKLTNFIWFDGTSSDQGKTGEWMFYNHETPETQSELFKFSYELSSSKEDVRAEIVGTSHEDFGNYLHWKTSGHLRSLEAYNAKKPEKVLVDWNMVNESGAITNLTENTKYCWDTNYKQHQNVTCE